MALRSGGDLVIVVIGILTLTLVGGTSLFGVWIQVSRLRLSDMSFIDNDNHLVLLCTAMIRWVFSSSGLGCPCIRSSSLAEKPSPNSWYPPPVVMATSADNSFSDV